MKLLLDENLSNRIISRVADLFPGSTHIKAVGLREADDFVVCEEHLPRLNNLPGRVRIPLFGFSGSAELPIA